MKGLGILAVVLAALVLASACGGGPKRYSLGERVPFDGWPDVVAVDFRRDVDPDELYEPNSLWRGKEPNENKEVVVITVQLINDEGEPFQVDPFYSFTLRSQGKEIDVTYELFADCVLKDQTLPPDKTIEGDLAYTIASGLRDLELVYQPGAGEATEQFFKDLAEGKLSSQEPKRAYITLE